MSQQPSHEPQSDRWLDREENVTKIWRAVIFLCVLAVLAQFFVDTHPHFAIEKLPAFYGLYGFISCVLLVFTSIQLRKLVRRDEDFYEQLSEDSSE